MLIEVAPMHSFKVLHHVPLFKLTTIYLLFFDPASNYYFFAVINKQCHGYIF